MATPRRNLTEKEIEEVWQKANIIPNNNPNVYRQDYAGAWIRRDQYGIQSEYGWEVDHIRPLCLDGTYEMGNMLPLQHQNNAKKGDNYPRWQTEVSAEGNHNVTSIRNWYVNTH